MILKKGAYGSFYACRNYPDCKTTKPYYKDTGVACPQCGKRILVKQSRSRKTFYSCEDYPNCKFSVWMCAQVKPRKRRTGLEKGRTKSITTAMTKTAAGVRPNEP